MVGLLGFEVSILEQIVSSRGIGKRSLSRYFAKEIFLRPEGLIQFYPNFNFSRSTGFAILVLQKIQKSEQEKRKGKR
ncbi:unnamed protein product [Calypogeia fissa]